MSLLHAIDGRFIKKQFCPRNHDTFVVGRDKYGACHECKRYFSRRYQIKHRKRFNSKRKQYYYTLPTDRNRSWSSQNIKNADGTVFTLVDFDRLYQTQLGVCKICFRHQSTLKKSLVVDHCHKMGIGRGLVCQGCNIKIGSVESKEFHAVLRYLNLEVH